MAFTDTLQGDCPQPMGYELNFRATVAEADRALCARALSPEDEKDLIDGMEGAPSDADSADIALRAIYRGLNTPDLSFHRPDCGCRRCTQG